MWHRVPGPPLSEHVALLWGEEAYAPGHAQEWLLPTGSMDLIVDFRANASLMVGAYSRPGLLDTSQPVSVMGAHFHPGGAFAFLSVPVDELHNRDVDLNDVWPAVEARVLRERLLAAPTPQRKLAVLEEALVARLKRAGNRAIVFAIGEFRRGARVAEVASRIGVSQRTFINSFAREVGMTPKLFCRVRRFNRALRMVHRRDDVDWTDVALACGYFDQPHLIRDFKAFSGLSPTAYLELRTEHLNHVPVP